VGRRFFHFVTIDAFDRQTDRRTDIWLTVQYTSALLQRVKIEVWLYGAIGLHPLHLAAIPIQKITFRKYLQQYCENHGVYLARIGRHSEKSRRKSDHACTTKII